ncbi:MAG TPA: DUF4387 domain-containing protein [Caulobacteraceae bacterium]|nr:DUF4387 domain-containing protein [Caulobacteraceae bacterium]
MKLGELASLIRSKNAGPFMLTFDVLFPSEQAYQRVKRSGVLSIERFARIYRCPPSSVRFFACDNARAFKFSMPRPLVQGDLGDGDMHGGQQFAPLTDLEIP